MNPVSVDVKDFLVAEGIGVFNATTGWSIACGYMPETPDTVIVLYDLAGRIQTTMDKTVEIRYDPVQIKVRGLSFLSTYIKARDIVLALRGSDKDHFVINDSFYLIFRDPVGPTQGERDDKERLSWVTTIEAVRKPL